MNRLIAVSLLTVVTLGTPFTQPAPQGDGTGVTVSVRVQSAIRWLGDQPVILGFARPQAWSIVMLDGYRVLALG